MKPFVWNEEKNQQLKVERGIGFEMIVEVIAQGYILDLLPHPNQKKYRGQRMFVVKIENYAYVVPFAEDNEKIFLKTIFPSRKATKNYIVNK